MTRGEAGLVLEDVRQDFGALAKFDIVAAAVSGGPDSVALLYLLSDWRSSDEMRGVEVVAVTVDHQLRAESRAEAEFVAAVAASLAIPHEILTWTGAKPTAGLPEAARRARYDLLEAFALRSGKGRQTAIATAHHLDDQAETFLMRLARGSGIDGLSAMRRERALREGSSVTLVRPLLAFAKHSLVATLERRGASYFDDPTNSCLDLERPRLRRALALLEEVGIAAGAIARSASRLQRAREAVAYADKCFLAGLSLETHDAMFASFDRAAFAEGPEILRDQLLARLIRQFGGATPEPQLGQIERLTKRFGEEEKFAATLGGASISAGPRHVRVWREVGRIDETPLQLEPGQTAIWDARFKVSLAATATRGVDVRPLGREDYQRLAPCLQGLSIPAAAAHGLPSIWRNGQLVSVPHFLRYFPSASPQGGPKHFEDTQVTVVSIH